MSAPPSSSVVGMTTTEVRNALGLVRRACAASSAAHPVFLDAAVPSGSGGRTVASFVTAYVRAQHNKRHARSSTKAPGGAKGPAAAAPAGTALGPLAPPTGVPGPKEHGEPFPFAPG